MYIFHRSSSLHVCDVLGASPFRKGWKRLTHLVLRHATETYKLSCNHVSFANLRVSAPRLTFSDTQQDCRSRISFSLKHRPNDLLLLEVVHIRTSREAEASASECGCENRFVECQRFWYNAMFEIQCMFPLSEDA